MKYDTIINEAEKRGLNYEFRKFMYWDNMLFVEDTAMVFTSAGKGGQNIVTPLFFPKFATLGYIFEAVARKAQYLGSEDRDWVPFSGRVKWEKYTDPHFCAFNYDDYDD